MRSSLSKKRRSFGDLSRVSQIWRFHVCLTGPTWMSLYSCCSVAAMLPVAFFGVCGRTEDFTRSRVRCNDTTPSTLVHLFETDLSIVLHAEQLYSFISMMRSSSAMMCQNDKLLLV